MDKNKVIAKLAEIYAEEMLREHNEQMFDEYECYDSYANNLDLLLNYYEEAVNGFNAMENKE